MRRIDVEERAALDRVLNRGTLSGFFRDMKGGPEVQAFEAALEEALGGGKALTCSNGTSALHLALMAIDVKPGDRVAVPALTFSATATAVLMLGGVPVPIDVDPKTWCMDPEDLSKAAEEAPLKAAIPVHLLGVPADMTRINDVASQKDFAVIEDNAQALLAKHKGQRTGTLGDLSTMSFQDTKVMTTLGEGGGIIVNGDFGTNTMTEKIMSLRNHGQQYLNSEGKYADYTCYDAETEILTKAHGFVGFQYLDAKDEVATLNPETECLEWQTPSGIHKIAYNGDLFRYEARSINFAVTPDHMMYCRIRGSNEFQLIPAWQMMNRTVEFLRTLLWNGKEPSYFSLPTVDDYNKRTKGVIKFPIATWVHFMGWWLAEGHTSISDDHYLVGITQKDEEYRGEIIALIQEMGFKPQSANENGQIVFSSKELCLYLQQFGKAPEKYIPIDLKDLSSRLLSELVETMLKGDGDGLNDYYTSSRRLADDFIEVAMKAGYHASMGVDDRPNRPYSDRPIYRITIGTTRGTPEYGYRGNHAELVPYEGYVHCVTVPEHHIILVRRKGRVMWSGNCWNYRMTEAQAAFGAEQLKKLPRWNEVQRYNRLIFRDLCDDAGFPLIFQEEMAGDRSTFYICGTRCYYPSFRQDAHKAFYDKAWCSPNPGSVISLGYMRTIFDLPLLMPYKTRPLSVADDLVQSFLWFDVTRWQTPDEFQPRAEQLVRIMKEVKKA